MKLTVEFRIPIIETPEITIGTKVFVDDKMSKNDLQKGIIISIYNSEGLFYVNIRGKRGKFCSYFNRKQISAVPQVVGYRYEIKVMSLDFYDNLMSLGILNKEDCKIVTSKPEISDLVRVKTTSFGNFYGSSGKITRFSKCGSFIYVSSDRFRDFPFLEQELEFIK
jgi:hypothetical protein